MNMARQVGFSWGSTFCMRFAMSQSQFSVDEVCQRAQESWCRSSQSSLTWHKTSWNTRGGKWGFPPTLILTYMQPRERAFAQTGICLISDAVAGKHSDHHHWHRAWRILSQCLVMFCTQFSFFTPRTFMTTCHPPNTGDYPSLTVLFGCPLLP